MPDSAAPQHLDTARLTLRRPQASDADAIFTVYANDAAVTRYLGWPRHQTLADTAAFLEFCESSWQHHGVGAYLVFDRSTSMLLGSTGLELEDGGLAATGYVLRQSAWGRGYATEALRAMLEVASTLNLHRIYALCHTEHQASAHVLEKCGFTLETRLPGYIEFPNLAPGEKVDVLRYHRHID